MHIPIKRKILLSLLLSLLVVIVIGYASYYTALAHNTSSEQTITSRKITGYLHNLLMYIVDAETGERNYTITGDTAYLEAYKNAIDNLTGEMTALRTCIDSASFSKRELSELDSVLGHRVAALESIVAGRRNTAPGSEFSDNLKRNDDNILMDGVRERITQMIKKEQANNDKYVNLANTATRRSNQIVTVCAIAALLILVLGSIFINRELNVSAGHEKELRKSKAELSSALQYSRDLYNNSPCGYHSLDSDGTIIDINDTELGWLGYRRSDVIGKLKFRDLLTDEGRKLFEFEYGKFKKTGVLSDTEFEIRGKDGSVFYSSVSSNPVYGKDHEYLHSRSSMFDITERKTAERKLLEYIDFAPDAVITVNKSGEIVRVNKQAEKLFGYERNELFGKRVELLMPMEYRERHVQHRNEFTKDIGNVQTGKNTEVIATCKDGTSFPAEITLSSITSDKEILVIAGIRDITEQKTSEKELLALNRLLQDSNNELETFSYSVSHDLRAPLRHIIGFGQKLLFNEKDSGNPESMRLVNKMNTAAAKMSRLIDDLLSLSKAGIIGLNKTQVDMNLLFEDIIKETVDGKYMENITWKIAPLKNAWADFTLIGQVVTNLVSNAVKYSSVKENIIIEIGNILTDNESIYFIKDNGAGFDSRYTSKLFGVFQRLHKENEFPGTGIGLAIVQRIIYRHGGRTWAEGETDRGATFYFSLPENEE